MITVTRLNDEKFVVNADLIELIESTPDTLVSLLTGRKLMVKESVDEIVERTIAYRKRMGVYHPLPVVVREED